MSNNVENIPISVETKQKLNELRRNDCSDEDLVRNIIEFAYYYRKSWYEYATKLPQYGMESLATIYVTKSTFKRLKEMCENSKDTVNNIIRDLIHHQYSCFGHHKPRKEFVIRVGNKANSKFFAHKPEGWTNGRFLIALLSLLEKNKTRLEDFQ